MTDAAKRKAAGWPPRCMDLRGLKVRLRREARNAYGLIPAGTTGTLGRYPPSSWERLDFTADACLHCGQAQSVSRMSWRDFDVIRPMLDQLEGAAK